MRRQGLDVATGNPIRVDWTGSHLGEIRVQSASVSGDDVYISPGFFDIQVNGADGVDFADPGLTVDTIQRAAKKLWQAGETQFLPTLITAPIDAIQASLARLARLRGEAGLADSVVGFHVEGPYISSQDGPRGAHPREACKDPDWDEFRRLQDAAEGLIRLITLAPERAGAADFIRRAVASGVRVALGHTAAREDDIRRAVDAGASLSTHLGNGAADMIQRHHNPIFEQLADDRLAASLIVDGHHLPPSLVKIFVRAKGMERIMLVSDAVKFAGVPPGEYDDGRLRLDVREDGFVGIVGEPRLAGSGTLLDRAIPLFSRFAETSLGAAVATATIRPAAFLGLEDRFGTLAPGKSASLVVFRAPGSGPLEIVETIVAGKSVFDASAAD